MSNKERRKGFAGEQEVARIFREAGHRVERLQQQQGAVPDLIVNGRLYVDSKRQERMRLPSWLRQARENAPDGLIPVVCFRQSRGEWYGVVPLADLVRMGE